MRKYQKDFVTARKTAAVIMFVLFVSPMLRANTITLGTAESFAVLAGSTITNAGTTVIFGNIGVAPGTSVTGFPLGIVTDGTIHSNTALAQQARLDVALAYDVLAGETSTTDLSGQDLGGRTLAPGVYRFSSSAQLTGSLVLDAAGDPNARFDFQIGSTLTTAVSSGVLLTNGGRADNVFFQVGSSATLGVGTTFAGNILAFANITLNNTSILSGKALAFNGEVTLDTNNIGFSEANVVPELSPLAFLGCVGLPLVPLLLSARLRNKHPNAATNVPHDQKQSRRSPL